MNDDISFRSGFSQEMQKKWLSYLVVGLIVVFTKTAVFSQYKEAVIQDTTTLQQYKNKIPLYLKDNSPHELGNTYKAIADYYHLKTQTDSAIRYYILANHQFEVTGDSLSMYICRHRIGSEISHKTEVQNSLFWLLPAIQYFVREKEYLHAAHTSNDIANVYKEAGNMVMSEYYVKKARYYNSFANDTLLSVIIHIGLASNSRKKMDTEASITESQKALQLARQSGYIFFQKIALLILADNYMVRNDLVLAEQSLSEAAALNHSGVSYELAYHRTMLAIKKGDKSQAKSLLSRFRELADSTISVKDTQNYVEQIARFETEKKQAFIVALEKENKLKAQLAERRQRFIYTLAIGLLALLAAGWYIIYNINKRKNLELELIKQEEQFTKKIEKEKNEKVLAEFNKQLAEVQLTALNAQMSPHFIFNCMNSIQKYVLKNEKEKALGFLQNFSELMRIVLDNSVKPKVQLDEEIKMLDKYILLEQQRLDYHFAYNIDVDKTLQTDFFEIPGMIIQPYVENAIWHGLMNKTDTDNKGKLTLTFNKENDYIKCVITDNGVGRKKAAELAKSKSPGHKSYGMAISQKRLELLKMDEEQLPRELVEDLYCNGEPCGTRVTLNIFIN